VKTLTPPDLDRNELSPDEEEQFARARANAAALAAMGPLTDAEKCDPEVDADDLRAVTFARRLTAYQQPALEGAARVARDRAIVVAMIEHASFVPETEVESWTLDATNLRDALDRLPLFTPVHVYETPCFEARRPARHPGRARRRRARRAAARTSASADDSGDPPDPPSRVACDAGVAS
jgi:hypothetical protein